jgi:hypothetical protein
MLAFTTMGVGVVHAGAANLRELHFVAFLACWEPLPLGLAHDGMELTICNAVRRGRSPALWYSTSPTPSNRAHTSILRGNAQAKWLPSHSRGRFFQTKTAR